VRPVSGKWVAGGAGDESTALAIFGQGVAAEPLFKNHEGSGVQVVGGAAQAQS
jgi:hypothetical protein